MVSLAPECHESTHSQIETCHLVRTQHQFTGSQLFLNIPGLMVIHTVWCEDN